MNNLNHAIKRKQTSMVMGDESGESIAEDEGRDVRCQLQRDWCRVHGEKPGVDSREGISKAAIGYFVSSTM